MTVKKIASLAVIAALYVGVSLLLAPISFASIQVRVAEALVLLPVIFPSSIWALTLGCLLTNLIGVFTGANILGITDVFVGTFATLTAAYLSYKLAKYQVKGYPLLATLPPILLNALLIGLELTLVLNPGGEFSWPFFWLMFIQVAIGQFLSVFVLGLPLIRKLQDLAIFKDFE